MHVTLKACGLAALIFASTAAAQEQVPTTIEAAAPDSSAEMTGPRIVHADVDWGAVRAELGGLDLAAPAKEAGGDAPPADPLKQLNDVMGQVFPNVTASAVPVLVPFDTALFLRDQVDGHVAETSAYLSNFKTEIFYPGPSGYDAAFSLEPQDVPGLDLTFVKRIRVQISGLALIYELDRSNVGPGTPVPELEDKFPGIRRIILESHVRYSFERHGVPYFVSILCFDGPKRKRRLSCREADKVAARFLDALDIVGGAPSHHPVPAAPQTIERPDRMSPDFTYYAPGDILPGTGMRGQAGRSDTTVYAKIRFPLEKAPAYANSQSFMNWGNCDRTGRVALGGHGKNAMYRCRVNGIPLVHNEAKNYAYPWRDNFCEHRYFYISQCPSGLGHQGEDIRPGSCKLRNDGADRCQPYQHDVVAASHGVAMRAPGEEAIYLLLNRPGEHIRFRYLHMNPHLLDAAGILSGREFAEGEVIGPADDYGERQGGTTYHLHFDVQVPTRQGWIYVNPYMTLVAAYERLIGGRGRMVNDAEVAAGALLATAPPEAAGMETAAPAESADATAQPNLSVIPRPRPAASSAAAPAGEAGVKSETTAAGPGENRPKSDSGFQDERQGEGRHGERPAVSAEHCKTHVAQGHRRRTVCWGDVAARSTRARHARGVRTVGRHFSHQSHGARHHARNVFARHGRGKARHGRA